MDAIAVLHERQRAADRRLGRHVQDDRAVRRAAHARIGDAHHVLDSRARKLRGNRQVSRFGHGVTALRPGVLEHEEVVGPHVEIRRVDPRRKIVERGEHHRPAFPLEERRVGGRALEDRAARRQAAEERDEPTDLLIRLRERAHDVAVDPRALRREALPERLARHRRAVEVEHRRQLAQHRAETARGIQI